MQNAPETAAQQKHGQTMRKVMPANVLDILNDFAWPTKYIPHIAHTPCCA